MEWIKVEDRLPEPDKMVLVVFCALYMTGYTYTVYFSMIHDGKWGGEIDRTKVTHWMPLPEPPKTET